MHTHYLDAQPLRITALVSFLCCTLLWLERVSAYLVISFKHRDSSCVMSEEKGPPRDGADDDKNAHDGTTVTPTQTHHCKPAMNIFQRTLQARQASSSAAGSSTDPPPAAVEQAEPTDAEASPAEGGDHAEGDDRDGEASDHAEEEADFLAPDSSNAPSDAERSDANPEEAIPCQTEPGSGPTRSHASPSSSKTFSSSESTYSGSTSSSDESSSSKPRRCSQSTDTGSVSSEEVPRKRMRTTLFTM